MDGIVDGKNSKECPLILLNPSLATIGVPTGTIIGKLDDLAASDFAPIEQVFQIHLNTPKPRLQNISHLANIKICLLPIDVNMNISLDHLQTFFPDMTWTWVMFLPFLTRLD